MRRLSFLVSGAFLFTATLAHAQTDLERATARDAANSGRAAFEAGQYEKAIDSFSRAESLVHAPPHLLFMARSQAKLGHLIAAHETYLKITRETLRPNAPKAFSDAQNAAEQELPSVDARLPYVVVTLQGASPEGVSVQMDSTALSAAMIGIPLPADPGQHVFKATGSATGDPVTVTLAEGAKQSVVLRVHSTGVRAAAIPAAAPAATSVAAPATGTAAPPSSTSSPPPSDSLSADTAAVHGSGLRIASYVSFGLGAVGLGGGTYFFLKSRTTGDEADKLYDQCRAVSAQGECGELRQQFEKKDSDANSQRTLGVVGLVVGGVGVAAGLTFLLIDLSSGSSKSAQNSAPRLIPVVGFETVGLAGTF